MRYLLAGYYGMRNVGDDILLHVTLANVRRIDPAATFRVFSAAPVGAPPGVEVERLEPGSRRLATLRQLMRSDVWLFGGGGVIQDSSPRSLATLANTVRWARLARWTGTKVALLGVGIGPLETARGRALAGRLLEAAGVVTVRDEASGKLAAEVAPGARAAVLADMAFLLPEPWAGAAGRGPGRNLLGLSLLDLEYAAGWGGGWRERGIRPLAEALSRVLAARPGWKLRLFEFFAGGGASGDQAAMEAFEAAFRFPERLEVCRYDPDCGSMYRRVAECGAFAGMRLHACVLAYMAGIPFLAIEYHPKCGGFAAAVGQPPAGRVPLDSLQDPDLLADRLALLLDRRQEFIPAVPPEAMAARARENFTVLGAWLRESVRARGARQLAEGA